jgi:hypothetical protein
MAKTRAPKTEEPMKRKMSTSSSPEPLTVQRLVMTAPTAAHEPSWR